jgi:hypothetical protein
MLDIRLSSLTLSLRSCACRITSRIERLPALQHSANQHSPVQHNLPLVPACLDNLLSRNLRIPCLVHSAMPVQIMQLREVPLAGWAKLRRNHNRRGDLVLSTRLSSQVSSQPSSQPSSRQRVALDLSTRPNNRRALAYSGATMRLEPKINR